MYQTASYSLNYLIIKKVCLWSLIIKLQKKKKKNPYLSLNKKAYKAAKIKTVSLGFTVSFLGSIISANYFTIRFLYTMYYPFLLVTIFFFKLHFFRLLLHNTKFSKH